MAAVTACRAVRLVEPAPSGDISLIAAIDDGYHVGGLRSQR
jgi:hypothetical protein